MQKTKPQRDALGKALICLGNENEKLVVLSPDVGKSTRVLEFKSKYPDRYFCTGISEQNTIGLASGLASMGWSSIVTGYAIFICGKTWEQIRNSVCYPNLNVKIVAIHGGINVGQDGVTHQSIEDIALMRAIPGLAVLAPCDANEVLPLLRLALSKEGPVYIRLEREPLPIISQSKNLYKIGCSSRLRDGKDITIIAIGGMVWKALEAAEILAGEGIQAAVINMYSLKPIDREAIIKAASETKCIITAEDHNRIGGLGSAVAEIIVQSKMVPMEIIAVDDTFAESGNANDLFEKYHLTVEDIVNSARRCYKKVN